MYNVNVYYSTLSPFPYVGKVYSDLQMDDIILGYLLEGCYYDGDAGMYIKQNSDHSLGYTVQAV